MKSYKILTLALFALFITGCGTVGNIGTKERTPTETIKAFNDASKKKDIETVKKLISKGTLKQLENSALAANTSVDNLLKKDSDTNFEEFPEIQGEKIEGDTAYVEIKNEITGENEKMPLIKEDGEWKIAFDKYLEDLRKRYTEEMNKIKDAENSSSNSNTKTVEVPKQSNANSAANKK